MCIDKPPKEINITAIISFNLILLIIVNEFKPCVSSKNPFMNTWLIGSKLNILIKNVDKRMKKVMVPKIINKVFIVLEIDIEKDGFSFFFKLGLILLKEIKILIIKLDM